MKRNPSKSAISNKKNKTISNAADSKKSSRIIKANSCVKINSMNSEQNSKQIPLTIIANSNRLPVTENLKAPYEHSHISQLIQPKQSHRPSSRNQGKSSVETLPALHQREELNRLRDTNQQISKENLRLKEKCCELQQMSLKDKEKIKNLIIRINQVKHSSGQTTDLKRTQPSMTQLVFNQNEISAGRIPSRIKFDTPMKGIAGPCENKQCQERKKYLQNELYRQRILRDNLQVEKKEWEKNRNQLKMQYNELLVEIKYIRDKQY